MLQEAYGQEESEDLEFFLSFLKKDERGGRWRLKEETKQSHQSCHYSESQCRQKINIIGNVC